MRQAGRYLPEFRNIRSQNQNFIDLCLNSELSSEITLQPIKRFDLDSAIIFSDILMVPYALNQEVKFLKDQGPKLSKFEIKKFLNNDTASFIKKLNPVYKAIKLTRKNLDKKKSLISFIGAPWTILVYMIGARLNKKEIDLKIVKEKRNEIKIILDKLNEYLCIHIENQVKAGADVVQVFDSWAGLISPESLLNFCYKPNQKIVNFCRLKKIPVICFPKGIKEKYKDFNDFVIPDGINIDYDIDPKWAKDNLKNVCLQGGMDPKILFEDEKKINFEVDKYLDNFRNTPYIFNLGHGLLPETNPDTLAKIINRVKSYK